MISKFSNSQGSIGFSLIELLVTIGIVSILASIAVAQFEEYRRRANDTIAISALRSAVIGMTTFFSDHVDHIDSSFCNINPDFYLAGCRYTKNGVITDVDSYEELLIGYKHPRDLYLQIDWNLEINVAGDRDFQIRAFAQHCKGTVTNHAGYEGNRKVFEYYNGQVFPNSDLEGQCLFYN